MNIPLRAPDAHDLSVLQEPGTTPIFFATSCALDQAGVELRIGGIVVAGLFEPLSEFENAQAITCDVNPSRPDERRHRDTGQTIEFWTPEELASGLLEEELEYEAWAMLEALAILRSRQEAAVEPNVIEMANYSPKVTLGSQNATQPSTRFLDSVGIMSHEEVAAAFDKHVTGATA